MSERMTFVLDGRDNLSTVFRDASGSAARFEQRLDRDMSASSGHVERFTRDSSGRLRDLRGRFASTSIAMRGMGGQSVGVRSALQNLGGSASETATAIGGKGAGLGGSMGAVAAIAGLSLLPALGALVPMMAGLGVAGGTMALGFRGVGTALEAASKGKEEYAAALKALPEPARKFTEQLVATKKEFTGLSGEIQKVMLPGFTKALKESSPIIKIVGSAMTEMGKGFGDAAAGVGRLMNDSGFQKDFSTVLRLGNVFVKDLTRGLGGLTRSFIEFGARSEPTLRSLSAGLGDLLGKGLPGMFQGLERGVDGSSQFLNGMFGMINNLLPALGRLSGEFARTFGPVLGEQMTLFGNVASRAMDAFGYAARALKPVMDDLTFGLKAAWLLAQPFASAFKDAGKAIVDAMLPAGTSIDGVRGPLQRLHALVQDNKLGLMEFARQGAGVMLTIAEGFIQYLPTVVGAFRTIAEVGLGALGALITGIAGTIGIIPGIGERFTKAAADFDQFKTGFLNGLQSAQNKTQDFSDATLPRLSQNRLKLDISSYESQIAVAKDELASVPPEGKSKLIAHIAELEKKVAEARAELASLKDKNVNINVRTYRTERTMFHPQSGGREVAKGGIIRGPGTSTSDSIPAWLSDGEYVLRAAAVDRLGVSNLDALNEGRALPSMAPSLGATAGASMPAAAPARTVIGPTVNITVQGAIDPIATAQQIQRLLLKVKRSYGGPDLGFA